MTNKYTMKNEITIRNIKTFLTEPNNTRLVTVKIETSEPGLYGVGDATFTQRPTAVYSAINDYLKPFLLGKSVHDIEDVWQTSNVSAYWRNGPVLNNAISGIDQALWDIKGKIAQMPVYDLLGGRSREAAAVYVHANGSDPKEVEDNARSLIEKGFHYIRVQVATPGLTSNYGSKQSEDLNKKNFKGPKWITSWVTKQKENLKSQKSKNPSLIEAAPSGIFEPRPYVRSALNLFEHLRNTIGWNFEMLHDVHERIPPIMGVWFAKEVEKYELFFLEDLFSPEDSEYFKIVRNQCSTPLAMGELWNNQHEYIPLIKNQLIDFIRFHMSQIGGITPAKKISAMSELFNIRTAWHGPGDTSPVGHAANLMLDINNHNFGIQEYAIPGQNTLEMFPGFPEVKNGYMWPNQKPGLGIDIDEKMASKFPYKERAYGGSWGPTRRADGTVIKP